MDNSSLHAVWADGAQGSATKMPFDYYLTLAEV